MRYGSSIASSAEKPPRIRLEGDRFLRCAFGDLPPTLSFVLSAMPPLAALLNGHQPVLEGVHVAGGPLLPFNPANSFRPFGKIHFHIVGFRCGNGEVEKIELYFSQLDALRGLLVSF